MSDRKKWFLLILVFFLFRLGFGVLRSQIWERDQFQTYLIGLKCYTTRTWPWFGPDVNGAENTAFHSQIPGALEGLLIGLPFYVLPLPEAPFVFLNLLSIAGVALLAWYIGKRIPGIPLGWLFAWIAVAPWSIHESSTIINPAFTFLPSILFFIGFMESLPFFTLGLVPSRLANAAMGFSLFWIMQFHFSYIYLAPLAAFSLGLQVWRGRNPQSVLCFILGSLPMAALIVPTYLRFGLGRANVASGFEVPFNWANVAEFWTITARFLSLVCFELPRFIGIDTKSRLDFLTHEHPWLLAPGAFLWIAGLLQPFVLLAAWLRGLFVYHPRFLASALLLLCALLAFSGPRAPAQLALTAVLLGVSWVLGRWLGRYRPEDNGPQWRGLNVLLALVFSMVFASFWFTDKLPLSHIYFVFFPFLMTYSCRVWMMFREKAGWRFLAKVFLVAAVFFQFGFALAVAKRDSIYPRWKAIKQAIDQKNYHLMGERRPGSFY
jgi:hypothetical protein